MLFLIQIVSILLAAGPLWSKLKPDQKVLSEYLRVQKEYEESSCNATVEKNYSDLDVKYRGDGNFIPVLLDQKVDQKTIKSLIPLIKEKISWIKEQSEIIKKTSSFEDTLQTIKRIENEVLVLQEAKKDYLFAKNKTKKNDIEERAKKQFSQLMKEVENLRNQSTFLLSFKFPLNHLSLRGEYEKFKILNTKEARPKANSVYLFRRIVQDGSYDENLAKNDSVIRAAFDTLYISLWKEKERTFLSENERSDFKYVLANFKNLLDQGQTSLVARFDEWEKRAERSLVFYQDLSDGKKVKGSETAKASEIAKILEDRARSLYNLKEFVLKKEAESYTFWAKQSELFQYLYALETILYAEVGRIDAPDALERRDVAQVVINRFIHATYNEITEADALYEYLPSNMKVKENKWLNVLFKEGEFSFTYFYIPGNLHIYCPDMSKVGQYLRRENVRIALDLMKKPRKNFPALRYFSRMSMYGRIEMDSLWEDYEALEEIPGKPVRNPKKLANLFKQDRYKFLYSFESTEKKRTYLVVEMSGRTYVVDFKNPKLIYYYRNPHQFRYFAPIK